MGRRVRSLTTSFLNLLILTLTLTTLLVLIPSATARPVRDSRPESHGLSSNIRETKDFHNGFPLGTMKFSGPSPGIGHRSFIPVQTTLGKVKDSRSGPSPGEGHDYGNDNHT
ncbi:hypothetical protein RHMOL_Rhmol11G0237200 [Rhododendron molle]|uniref:Uncharacterized protein n=1 Tax=Rhododendron molle TaxID=49168 RepID=A0ACC0LWK3_RHOML|nr:hypothetical protein RHMOL_Rhmol11G0237200 [Rhododendron molle]